MRNVVITGAARTPMGGFQGAFQGLTAAELGGSAIKAALGTTDPAEVQELLIAGAAAPTAASHDSPLPLEFRTSPPEGAHRPTRSLSPPLPKLFLADHQQHINNALNQVGQRHASTHFCRDSRLE